ncbi:MAG: hypothetical protein WC797_04330, partial [Candidatus Paceibacterota bacterium]
MAMSLEEILKKDWTLLVTRPYTLFGTSLYQRWFDPKQINDLFGVSIPDNLYIEERPNSIRRYVLKDQLDKFSESIDKIIKNDRERAKDIFKKGLALGEQAKTYLDDPPFDNLEKAVNFLVDLTLHATVFSYFGYPVAKEVNDVELLDLAEKLRGVSYYSQVIEKIIEPLAQKMAGENYSFLTLTEISSGKYDIAKSRKKESVEGKKFIYSMVGGTELVSYVTNTESVIKNLEQADPSAHGWQLYFSRPHTLFTASLWQLWYESPETKKILDVLMPDAILKEEPLGQVNYYVRPDQLDTFKNSFKKMLAEHPDSCFEALKIAGKYNEEAKEYVEGK